MKVGILGGGQLGRMLALAGHPLGFTFRFMDPAPEAPAAVLGEIVTADYTDAAAMEKFLRGLDVVTYEFENVPASVARRIARSVPVFPPVEALEAAQDRLPEKTLFRSLGLGVPDFEAVATRAQLVEAVERLKTPCVLKTRRFGYDGKGQRVIRSGGECGRAWDELSAGDPQRGLIVESFVPFAREVSALGVRGLDGQTRCYPLVHNVHAEGILRTSHAPDPDRALGTEAAGAVTRIMDRLEYVGVLAVEFFVVSAADGSSRLLANEMAPRVHNSGHWTIEGAVTSQFENHLRAIAALPLGETGMAGPAGTRAVMVNLIGRTGLLRDLAAVPGAHIHLYGKEERAGRKVGHVTVMGQDGAELDRVAQQIATVAGQRLH